jgi:GxxExxY protein
MRTEARDQPQRHRDGELDALEPITRKIIGAAIEVHRKLGPGLPERVYEKALRIEFDLRGIMYLAQVAIAAVYKEHVLGNYRVDFVVDDSVVVEIKSVAAVLPVFESQVLTYLRLTKKRVGLILNFHEAVLKDGIRRLAL